MSIDLAQDTFRVQPNKDTAMAYAREAKQYFEDEMIGVDTVAAIAAELERRGFKAAMLFLMS